MTYCNVIGCRPCRTISTLVLNAPPEADGEEEMWTGRFFSAEHPWHVECQDERGGWWPLDETIDCDGYRFSSQVDAELLAVRSLRGVERWTDCVAVRVRNVDSGLVGAVLRVMRGAA